MHTHTQLLDCFEHIKHPLFWPLLDDEKEEQTYGTMEVVMQREDIENHPWLFQTYQIYLLKFLCMYDIVLYDACIYY